MLKKKSAYVWPVVVLLVFSLILTASTVGTRADAQSVSNTRHFTAYIHNFDSANGTLNLTADEMEWYEGGAADQVFAEREPEAAAELGGTPDGYYIVNDSDVLTTYPVADNATVYMQIYDHTGQPEDIDIEWNESISLEKLMAQFSNTNLLDISEFPYHITTQDGVITSIVQQYLP
ncbi:hypothetical protein GCM10010912_62520 [Paenibacillus albidus]|uniref:Uncharacterized protein n=1 Tax=Paenibacillus albidus TaxID=2041023 RepID=A0A917D3G8_9BACL|nr:hypothetical protein [Paenibacillus albidus]GGG09540.1 hypothetical protein GCM10010912_62520 [Paenibacillus albidus]